MEKEQQKKYEAIGETDNEIIYDVTEYTEESEIIKTIKIPKSFIKYIKS